MPLNKVRNIRVSIFVVGFTTLITQIVFIRSFLAIFQGQEMVIGIALSNWLLLSALGVYVGKYVKVTKLQNLNLLGLHVILGFLPLLIEYLIYLSLPHIFHRGSALSLTGIYWFTLISMAPISFLSGLFFSTLSKILSLSQKANKIADSYAFGALGALTGGLLFNFIFILLFKEGFSLKLLMILNILTGLFLYFTWFKSTGVKVAIVATLLLAAYFLTADIDQFVYQKQFGTEKLIESIKTQSGHLCVTEADGENNFYENGYLLGTTNDIVTAEENVHYSMLQHLRPKNILMISGGLSSALDQLNKYNVNSIDYVEINPELIRLQNTYSRPLSNYPKVNIVKEDARIFLRKYEKKYDVVLINLPDPVNLRFNRYFTLNFFEELKLRLTSTSIVSISLTSASTTMNDEMKEMHTALFSTLSLLFDHVIIVPGQRNYFLASDKKLTHLVSGYYKSKGISNEYVNPYYIDNDQITKKRNQIEKSISKNIIINYDFDPITFHIQFIRWLNASNLLFFLIFIILAIIFLYIVPHLHFVNIGIFASGFSASSLQLILIFAFQTIYGYAYYMLGIFFSMFFLGILIGTSWLAKKITINFKNYSFIQYLFGIVAILVPVILFNIQSNQENTFFIYSVFLFFTLIIGALSGVQFGFGSSLRFASISKTATGTIGSDILGGAMGAILVSLLLIPLFGIIKVSLLIGIVNFITGLIVLIKAGGSKA